MPHARSALFVGLVTTVFGFAVWRTEALIPKADATTSKSRQAAAPTIACSRLRFEDHVRYLDAFIAEVGITSAYLLRFCRRPYYSQPPVEA